VTVRIALVVESGSHAAAVVQAVMVRIREAVRRGEPAPPLELLAEERGVSGRTLQRHMRDVLGKSLRDVIAEIRIQRALLLVQTTAMPLADVAAAVGFGSQSRMSEMFRRHLRQSPGRFRDRPAKRRLSPGNSE
jgi:transcriptional regulator GlxA family with amidase domain